MSFALTVHISLCPFLSLFSPRRFDLSALRRVFALLSSLVAIHWPGCIHLPQQVRVSPVQLVEIILWRHLGEGPTANHRMVRTPEHVKVIFGIKYCPNPPENAIVVIITCATLCSWEPTHHRRGESCWILLFTIIVGGFSPTFSSPDYPIQRSPLWLFPPVSCVKCHFWTIMMISMHGCEDMCHNSMHSYVNVGISGPSWW